MPSEPPDGIVGLVDGIIRRAIDLLASDVHLDRGDTQVRVRTDGLPRDIDTLPAVVAPNVVARLEVLRVTHVFRRG